MLISQWLLQHQGLGSNKSGGPVIGPLPPSQLLTPSRVSYIPTHSEHTGPEAVLRTRSSPVFKEPGKIRSFTNDASKIKLKT